MPRTKKDTSDNPKIVKEIPKTEDGPGVVCINKRGERYHVSWCRPKMTFTLWHEIPGKGYEKVRSGSSPLELYEDIPEF